MGPEEEEQEVTPEDVLTALNVLDAAEEQGLIEMDDEEELDVENNFNDQ